MINAADLTNRENTEVRKICVRFEYTVQFDNDVRQKFIFTRHATDVPSELDKIWLMETYTPRTANKDTEHYYFTYVLPRAEMPLELVCATGLRYYQMYLKDEVQTKSDTEFVLGQLIGGM